MARLAGLDGRRALRIVGAAALAAVVLTGAAPAAAENARDYFVMRGTDSATPRQLDQEERAYYVQLFGAIDAEDWAQVQALFAQREHGPLHPVGRRA